MVRGASRKLRLSCPVLVSVSMHLASRAMKFLFQKKAYFGKKKIELFGIKSPLYTYSSRSEKRRESGVKHRQTETGGKSMKSMKTKGSCIIKFIR